MNRNVLTVAALVAATGLTACQRPVMAANSKLCADFKSTAASTGGAAPVEDCLKRWAYSLAASRDGADLVAGAAVAACQGALGRWNQLALAQPGQDAAEEALSITTGQSTNPMAEHYAFAQAQALLYTVEARAGDCAPPPIAEGRPAGTSD